MRAHFRTRMHVYIEAATKMLKAVSWEAIGTDRFSLTPKGLYDDLVRITQQALSSWGGDRRRREARMKSPLEMDDEGKGEAQKEVAKAEDPMRPKDKYGVAAALATVLHLSRATSPRVCTHCQTVCIARLASARPRMSMESSVTNSQGASVAGRRP